MVELPRQPVRYGPRVGVRAGDQTLVASQLEQAARSRVHPRSASRTGAGSGTFDQRQLEPQRLGGAPGDPAGFVGAAVQYHDRLEAAGWDRLRRKRLQAAGDVVLLVARGDHDDGN